MITSDNLNVLNERLEALKTYLIISDKLEQIAEQEKHTNDPDFWNEPKQAESVMRGIGDLKVSTSVFDLCEAL